MPVFISELKLTNILSFGPEGETIPLGPLNVLIGANGSGKSNIISAISLLQAAPGDIGRPIVEGGGVDEWVYKGADGSNNVARLASQLETPPAAGLLRALGESSMAAKQVQHSVEFTRSSGQSSQPIMVSESLDGLDEQTREWHPLYLSAGGSGLLGGVAFWIPDGQRSLAKRPRVEEAGQWRFLSVLNQRKDPSKYPEITWLGETYSTIKIYRDWRTDRESPIRSRQRADLDGTFLEEDGSNLFTVLNRLQRDSRMESRLLKELNSFSGDFSGFYPEVFGGYMQLLLKEDNWKTPASRLSDGTLRYLCLLAILLHPSPPPLICIEEPELGLHPDMMHKLAALLIDASTRTQLIITTHSDVLVDALHDTPESIVVCEKHDGRTKVRRLDPEHLKPWLEEYRLGTLWRRGDIGGNRW